MRYAYEDLWPEQFEQLIVLITQRLLGIGVQGSATGPDGGRDARFEGAAELHPSKAAPWVGRTIIQAKHTNGLNKYYNESDFYSETSDNCVIAQELPRICALKKSNELDHYMLFANRRLTGGAESQIRSYIASTAKVATGSIYLCGIEQIEVYLKRFPEIPGEANVDLLEAPLIVSPQDLAEVVEAFSLHKQEIMGVIDDPPVSRVPLAEKDKLNQMSPEYSKALRRLYLKNTAQIQQFLANPMNQDLLELYEATTEEIQLKIIAHRSEYALFDDVMNYLFDLLFARDPILRRHKRLTRSMIFHMYWSCDLGKRDDAETIETLAS